MKNSFSEVVGQFEALAAAAIREAPQLVSMDATRDFNAALGTLCDDMDSDERACALRCIGARVVSALCDQARDSLALQRALARALHEFGPSARSTSLPDGESG
jgi:hypothetical protein